MGLEYPTAAALASSLRMRLDVLPDDTPLLVVEGTSDRATLAKVIHPRVVVIPATNKNKVLGSREFLQKDDLARCAFLIDCDGEVELDWRPFHEIIVSDHRDLDADTAVSMGALQRVLTDFLAARFETGHKLRREVDATVSFMLKITAQCGIVTDRARIAGVPIRVREQHVDGSSSKRRIRPDDLKDFRHWALDLSMPAWPHGMINSIAEKLDWVEPQRELVADAVHIGSTKQCRRHMQTDCGECIARTFVNGHDLLAVAREALEVRLGISLDPAETHRLVRLAVSDSKIATWSVRKRLYARGVQTGLRYV